MARLISLTMFAAAAFQAVSAQESTEIAITEGLTTTLTLPAFPTPTSTETVIETSVILSYVYSPRT
jgi:hypothetical protein